MEYSYNKSVNTAKLLTEIESQPILVDILVSVRMTPNNITLVKFSQSLAPHQKSTLDTVVNNHDPSTLVSKVITKLQFRSLFTITEKMALDTSMEPIIVTIREDFKIAEFIDLDDPRVHMAISVIKDYGIVTETRMVQILSNTPPA